MTDSDLEDLTEILTPDDSHLQVDPIDHTFLESDEALAELIAELGEELIVLPTQTVQTEAKRPEDTTSDQEMSGAATMFGSTNPLSEEAVISLMTKHKKENRAAMSEKDLNRVLEAATAPLGQKLVVQSSLGTSQVTGEESTDLNTSEIATLYAYNAVTKDMMRRQMLDYDMTSAALVYRVVNPQATHPTSMFGGEPVNLLVEIGTIGIDEVKLFSSNVMKYDKPGKEGVYRQNLMWTLYLLRQVVSTSVSTLIDPVFESLPVYEQNGMVYLKMVDDLIFQIDDHVILSLQAYIRKFGKTGLFAFENENVIQAKTEIVGIATRLSQLEELPKDSKKDVLSGLQKCSNQELKEAFKLMGNLQNQSLIQIHTKSSTTLGTIKDYFEEATSLYTSAITRGTGFPKKQRLSAAQLDASDGVTCWNCGGKHRAQECPEPFNKTTFEANKKKFYEARNSNRRKGGKPKSDPGNGDNKNKKSGSPKGYSRSTFGSTNGVIVTSTGDVFTCCSVGTQEQGCGLNKTHSTKYHANYMANPQGYKMPSTHPFIKKQIELGLCLPASGGSNTQPVTTPFALSAAFAAKAQQLETQATDPDMSRVLGALRQVFQ